MKDQINKSEEWGCQTKAFYKGAEIDLDQLTIVWSNCCGKPYRGSLYDFERSVIGDAVAELEAGESW